MDYARIYREFVADRLRKQPEAPTYFERHHILPRSLGGGDEPDNMIRLTPEDHYFAHLLLAKTHGGKMWSAVWIMANRKSAFPGRALFGMIRRKAAARRSDHMKSLWECGVFTRNRTYLPHTDEFKKRQSERFKGRQVSKAAVEKMQTTRRASAKEFSFVSERGDRFTGTQKEFALRAGISQSLASNLTRAKITSAKGWVLCSTNMASIKGRDPTVRVFRNKDGAEFVGTQYEFRTVFSLDTGVVTNLIKGKNGVKTFKGWAYCGEKKA